MELWDGFLEDYANEIHDWSTRQLLEIFWHYCQNGSKSVFDFLNSTASQQPDSADAEIQCTCEYPYLGVPGCPKHNPSKLVPHC